MQSIIASINLDTSSTFFYCDKKDKWGTDPIFGEQYIFPFNGTLLEVTGTHSNRVGEFNGRIVYLKKMLEGEGKDPDLSFFFDRHAEGNLHHFAEALEQDGNKRLKKKICKMNRIIYIDLFFLEKEYRNKGIGFGVLSHLDSVFLETICLDFEAIILQPCPQERGEFGKIECNAAPGKDEREKSLQAFYQRVGFSPIPKSDLYILK